LKINSLKRGGAKINNADFHPNLRECENELKMNSDFYPNLRECENQLKINSLCVLRREN